MYVLLVMYSVCGNIKRNVHTIYYVILTNWKFTFSKDRFSTILLMLAATVCKVNQSLALHVHKIHLLVRTYDQVLALYQTSRYQIFRNNVREI